MGDGRQLHKEHQPQFIQVNQEEQIQQQAPLLSRRVFETGDQASKTIKEDYKTITSQDIGSKEKRRRKKAYANKIGLSRRAALIEQGGLAVLDNDEPSPEITEQAEREARIDALKVESKEMAAFAFEKFSFKTDANLVKNYNQYKQRALNAQNFLHQAQRMDLSDDELQEIGYEQVHGQFKIFKQILDYMELKLDLIKNPLYAILRKQDTEEFSADQLDQKSEAVKDTDQDFARYYSSMAGLKRLNFIKNKNWSAAVTEAGTNYKEDFREARKKIAARREELRRQKEEEEERQARLKEEEDRKRAEKEQRIAVLATQNAALKKKRYELPSIGSSIEKYENAQKSLSPDVASLLDSFRKEREKLEAVPSQLKSCKEELNGLLRTAEDELEKAKAMQPAPQALILKKREQVSAIQTRLSEVTKAYDNASKALEACRQAYDTLETLPGFFDSRITDLRAKQKDNLAKNAAFGKKKKAKQFADEEAEWKASNALMEQFIAMQKNADAEYQTTAVKMIEDFKRQMEVLKDSMKNLSDTNTEEEHKKLGDLKQKLREDRWQSIALKEMEKCRKLNLFPEPAQGTSLLIGKGQIITKRKEFVTKMDDKYASYHLMSNTEAKEMIKENPANDVGSETFNMLYGVHTRWDDQNKKMVNIRTGNNMAYIRSHNSREVNRILRAKESDDPQAELHKIWEECKNKGHGSTVNVTEKEWFAAQDKLITSLTKATKGNTLKQDTRLFRMVGPDYFLKSLGLGTAEDLQKMNTPGSADNLVNAINKKAGTVLKDASFMSTGFKVDSAFATLPMMLTILADKGTKCMVTTNLDESELILGPNQRYMIIGAYAHGEKGKHVPLSVQDELANTSNSKMVSADYKGLEVVVKLINDNEAE